MNEKELVKKAQSGDFEAFASLVSSQQGRIYNLALKMTGNRSDAEDVVQDTMLKAIDKIDQFRGEASFGTWLYSIALNETRTHLAGWKRTDLKTIEEYLPGEDMHSNSTKSGPSLFDWQDPHQLLEQDELRKIIDDGIEQLPVEYREAFLLRYIEELSIKEVAQLIGESIAATKSRVLRARLALRDYLSHIFEDRYGQKV